MRVIYKKGNIVLHETTFLEKLVTVIITGQLTNSSWHLYRKCFVVSLDIDDFTFIAHAQKRQPERFKRPDKCKRDNAPDDIVLTNAVLHNTILLVFKAHFFAL